MIVRDIIWIPTRVTAKEILQQVASRHNMTVDEMLSATRKKTYARARQEAMWEIRQRTKLSYPQIAQRMRLKDHTTVIHGERRHAERLSAQEQGVAA